MISMLLTFVIYLTIYSAVESKKPTEPMVAPEVLQLSECVDNQCRYNVCRMGGQSPQYCRGKLDH